MKFFCHCSTTNSRGEFSRGDGGRKMATGTFSSRVATFFDRKAPNLLALKMRQRRRRRAGQGWEYQKGASLCKSWKFYENEGLFNIC